MFLHYYRYILASQALLDKQARHQNSGIRKNMKNNISGKFLPRENNKQALASKKRQFGMWMCLSDVASECLSQVEAALDGDNSLELYCSGLNTCLLLLTNLLKSSSYCPSEDLRGSQLQALSHHAELLLSYWEKHKQLQPDTVIMCLDCCLRLNHVLVHKRLKRIMLMCFSHTVPSRSASSLIQSIVSTYTRLRQLTHLIPIYCCALEEATSCGFSPVYPSINRYVREGDEKLRTELLYLIVLSWEEAFSSTPELLVVKVWGLLSKAVCKDYCGGLMVSNEASFKRATNDSICGSAALGLLGLLTTSMKLSSRIADKVYDLAKQLVTNNLGPCLLQTMTVLQESSQKRKRSQTERLRRVGDTITTLIELIELCCPGLSLYVSLLSFIERCKVWLVSDDRKLFNVVTPLPLLKYVQLANSYLEKAARSMCIVDPKEEDSTRKDAIENLNLVRHTLQEVSLQAAFFNQNDARDLVKLSYVLNNDGDKSWAYNTWEISTPTIAQWAPLADEMHVNSFIDSLVIGAAKEMQQECSRNHHNLPHFSLNTASKHLALLSNASSFEIKNFSCHLLPRIIFKAEELIQDDYCLHCNTVCCLWMIAEQLPIPCCVNKGSYLTLWGTLLSLEDNVAAEEMVRATEKTQQTTMHIRRCMWKLCSKLSMLVEGEVREEGGMLFTAERYLLRIVHRVEQHAKYSAAELAVAGVELVESLARVCLTSKSTHGPEFVLQLLSDSFSCLKNLKAAITANPKVHELSLQGGVPLVVEGLTKAIAKSMSMCSDSNDTELLGGLAKNSLHLLIAKQKSQIVLNNHVSLTGAIFRLAGSVFNDAKAMVGWPEWAHYQLQKYFPLDGNSSGSLIKLDDSDTLDMWCTLLCDACQSFFVLPNGMECFQRLAGCCIFFSRFTFSSGDEECPHLFVSLPPPLQMGLSKLVASGEEGDLRWLFAELCNRLSSPFPSLGLLQCVGLILRAGTGDGFNSVMMDFYPKLALYLSRVADDCCHSISCGGISHRLDLATSGSGARLALLALESLLTRGQCSGIGPQHISCIMGSLAAIAASTRCNSEVVKMADWYAPCASTAAALVQFCHRRVFRCLPVITSLCCDLIHFCLSDKCDSGGRNALNRLLSGLVTYKNVIRWYTPPLLVTYVQRVLDGTNVSPLEHRMIAFTLLDICTQADVETILKWLHHAGVDVFQNLYKDYLNKHKYTGSV